MATFGASAFRPDPLRKLSVAASSPDALLEDMYLYAIENDLRRRDAFVERYEPISQARGDDAALPMTRFGEYPD